MIKRAHEAPKSIFREVQSVTDYDYFLVHLFEEDPEYLQLARESVAKGRETILDNSIFELGTAFNMGKFANWVNEIKPTWYIVPDSLENKDKTISNMREWVENYKASVDPKCKMIGVVQGKTYEELVECYEFMLSQNVDKIAFSFDLSLYERMCPTASKLLSWTIGRVTAIGQMVKDGIIDTSRPHHLLGCALPLEFQCYSPEWTWIDSVDTSNPVIAGIKRELYDSSLGLRHKDSVKLYTLINAELDKQQKAFVMYNIDVFKKFCNESKFE